VEKENLEKKSIKRSQKDAPKMAPELALTLRKAIGGKNKAVEPSFCNWNSGSPPTTSTPRGRFPSRKSHLIKFAVVSSGGIS
jgi:hypothetical protein